MEKTKAYFTGLLMRQGAAPEVIEQAMAVLRSEEMKLDYVTNIANARRADLAVMDSQLQRWRSVESLTRIAGRGGVINCQKCGNAPSVNKDGVEYTLTYHCETCGTPRVGLLRWNERQLLTAAMTIAGAVVSGREHTRWLLIFEDSERGYSLYEDETLARDAYGKASESWACHLFAPVSALDAERDLTARLKKRTTEEI